MKRRALSPSCSTVSFSRLTALLALSLACASVVGCNKDKKGDGDAAADAAADATAAVADAAADAAVADAAADAADAAPAPVTTVVQPKVGKPKPIDPPICAAARSAKQRNSPAAPGLERQCVAAGGTM